MLKELAQDFIMKQVANQVEKTTWIDSKLIEKVADEWLWSMIFGLAKNVGTPEGAQWLMWALNKDHDGSILDNVWALLSDDKQKEGNKILDHILWNKKDVIETQIGKDTWLDIGQVSSILKTIAPILLWFLGKKAKSDGFWLDDIVGLLSKEKEQVAEKSTWLWIFGAILDQDGDGDFDMIDAFKMIS